MKKFRILALAVAALLMVCVLAGCSTSADDITVTLIIKTSPEAEPYFNQEIKVTGEGATVEKVVNEANIMYDLGYAWTDLGALTHPEYPDQFNEDNSADSWVCLINGAEPESGRAKDAAVADGAVITYTYTHEVVEAEG